MKNVAKSMMLIGLGVGATMMYQKYSKPVMKENNSENNFLKAQKNDEELTEKERAKREFLDGYNRQYEDDFEEERPRSSRKKGKRFK